MRAAKVTTWRTPVLGEDAPPAPPACRLRDPLQGWALARPARHRHRPDRCRDRAGGHLGRVGTYVGGQCGAGRGVHDTPYAPQVENHQRRRSAALAAFICRIAAFSSAIRPATCHRPSAVDKTERARRFKAMFAFRVPLEHLNPRKVANLGKAIANSSQQGSSVKKNLT